MTNQGGPTDIQTTKKKRYTKKIKEINFTLQEDIVIRREGNSILLPYFSFDKKKRTDYVEYKIKFGKRDGVMEVHSSAGLGIPTEFDYKVFIGIMRIFEQQGGVGETVTFSLNDIIKQIGISKGGRNYDLIRSSILRLKRTNYVMKHIFIEKIPKDKMVFQGLEDEGVEAESFAGFSGDIKNISVSVDDTNTTIVKQEEEMSIFVHRTSEDRYTEGGDHISSKFTLEFSKHMINNLKNDYFRKFSSTKLLSLERGVLMRLFEITDYQRGKRLRHAYVYTTLIMMIPLDSNNGLKKNIKYILSYIDELVRLGYVKGYEPGADRVTIEFFPNRTGGYEQGSGSRDEKASNDSYTLTDDDEILRGKIGSFLDSVGGRVNIGLDGVMMIVLESGIKDEEIVLSNLEYSINESKKNVLGFFQRSLKGDWAKDLRKLKESKTKQLEMFRVEEEKKASEAEEVLGEKQLKNEIFDQYISGLTDHELNDLYARYEINKKHSVTTRNVNLRIKLFQDGTLKIKE